jgi:hypothetical protein
MGTGTASPASMSTGAGAIGTGAAIASAPMAIGAGGRATISALSTGAGGNSTGAGGSSSACGLLRPPPRFPAATHATTTARQNLRICCPATAGGDTARGDGREVPWRNCSVASIPSPVCKARRAGLLLDDVRTRTQRRPIQLEKHEHSPLTQPPGCKQHTPRTSAVPEP